MVCVRCGGLRGQTGERVRHRWRTISRADKVAQALGLLEHQRDTTFVGGVGRRRSWVVEADPSSLAELALAEKDAVVARKVETRQLLGVCDSNGLALSLTGGGDVVHVIPADMCGGDVKATVVPPFAGQALLLVDGRLGIGATDAQVAPRIDQQAKFSWLQVLAPWVCGEEPCTGTDSLEG